MKEYVLKIPEIRNRKITVAYDDRSKDIQIFSDGSLLLQSKDLKYFIEDDNGRTIIFEWNLDEKDNLRISAGGVPLVLSPKLAWYEWTLCGIPLILVFTGGLIGGVIGGAAFYGNLKIMQSLLSRPLKYLATVASSFIVISLVIGIAVGLNPNARKAFAKGFSEASESMTPPELGTAKKSKGTPNLYADNGTDKALQLSIDGRDSGTVPPFSFLPLTVKHGKHKFVFTEAGKPYDTVEGEIPEGKAAVVNPKGAASYAVVTASYVTDNLGGFGGGFGYQDAAGQNFVTADYGLLESLPEKIEVKVKASEIGKSFSRSKIAKKIPNEMDSREAYSIIKNYMDKSEQAFSFEDKEHAMIVLLTALGREPKSPDHCSLLLEQAEKSERYVLEAALKSLAKYEKDIPDDKLLKIAVTPEKVNTSGMSFDSPAANGRGGWAMRSLLERGKVEMLLNEYPKLDEYQRNMFLKIAAATENLDPKPIIACVLDSDPPKDSFAIGSIAQMIMSDNFNPDDPLMEKIDAFIPKIVNQDDRNNLQESWNKKLSAMNDAGAKSDYLQKRLLASLNAGGTADAKALKPMVKQGLYDKLIENFPTFDGQVKRELILLLPRKELDKVPKGALDLAWLAVSDPGESVSAVALNYLADNSSPDIEFLRKAWKYSSSIDDAAAKKRFDENLWSNSYSKIGKMEVSEICAVAAESPTRNFVKQAIDRLQQDSDKKAANFAELAAAWPKISSEANKVWIMQEIKDVSYIQFAVRKPEELKAFKTLFNLGFADKSAAVRAAALDASFRLEQPDYPDEKTSEKIIASDLPKDQAADIRRNYEFWICNTWRNLTRDRNQRTKALDKIIGVLEKTDNPEVAKFAANELDHPTPEEKNYIADLARLAKNSKFKECRKEALQHISAIDFTKDDEVVSAFTKALESDDADLRYRAFTSLGHKCQKYNADFRAKYLPRLKAAAAKESDQKTKGDMENFLKNALDAYADDKPNPDPAPVKTPRPKIKNK